jgi:hypothetical protein
VVVELEAVVPSIDRTVEDSAVPVRRTIKFVPLLVDKLMPPEPFTIDKSPAEVPLMYWPAVGSLPINEVTELPTLLNVCA